MHNPAQDPTNCRLDRRAAIRWMMTAAALMHLPFSNGKWLDSEPVRLQLVQGKNTLRFWRYNPPQQGLAVKSHALRLVP